MKRTALVTGGSRGIGKGIAIQLSQDHSYHIIINYFSNEVAANETSAIIIENGGKGSQVAAPMAKQIFNHFAKNNF